MGGTRRVDVCGAGEIEPGTMRMAWVDGTEPVLVVNVEGTVRAVSGVCTHEYFELDTGLLQGRNVTCSLHLSRFDLATGKALEPPASDPLEVYPVSIEGGRVIIEFPG